MTQAFTHNEGATRTAISDFQQAEATARSIRSAVEAARVQLTGTAMVTPSGLALGRAIDEWLGQFDIVTGQLTVMERELQHMINAITTHEHEQTQITNIINQSGF
jgi:hypothetical protein